jgi:hypothetical protein
MSFVYFAVVPSDFVTVEVVVTVEVAVVVTLTVFTVVAVTV